MSEEKEQNAPDNKFGRHMQIYAQMLRFRGGTLQSISRELKVSESWVRRHTEPGKLPPIDRRRIIEMIEVLIMKTVLDALADDGLNPKEYAWPLSQYTAVLKQLEETTKDTTRRNIVEGVKALQGRMADAPPEFMDRLQAEYDKALDGE